MPWALEILIAVVALIVSTCPRSKMNVNKPPPKAYLGSELAKDSRLENALLDTGLVLRHQQIPWGSKYMKYLQWGLKRVCVHTYVYTNIYTYIYMCMYIHIYARTYLYRAYFGLYIYRYLYIYVYIYIEREREPTLGYLEPP